MKDAGGRDRSPCPGFSLLPLPLEERVLSTHPPRMGRDPKQLRGHMCAKSLQLYPTLCDPMDCSPPGSSVRGIPQGKNTGEGCHALLQGIFSDTRAEPQFLTSPALEPPGKPETSRRKNRILSALFVCFYNKQTFLSPCTALTSPFYLKPKHRLCLEK